MSAKLSILFYLAAASLSLGKAPHTDAAPRQHRKLAAYSARQALYGGPGQERGPSSCTKETAAWQFVFGYDYHVKRMKEKAEEITERYRLNPVAARPPPDPCYPMHSGHKRFWQAQSNEGTVFATPFGETLNEMPPKDCQHLSTNLRKCVLSLGRYVVVGKIKAPNITGLGKHECEKEQGPLKSCREFMFLKHSFLKLPIPKASNISSLDDLVPLNCDSENTAVNACKSINSCDVEKDGLELCIGKRKAVAKFTLFSEHLKHQHV
mmetsp:Transcript_12871/g.17587  ORF Transcript_12871/g.17587 Transcript_12871/m.17587 type:complete len:265 (+) Transcript_12871:106-900(+)